LGLKRFLWLRQRYDVILNARLIVHFYFMLHLMDFDQEQIIQILNRNPEEFAGLIEPLSDKRYHLKQLDIDRNTYLNWEKLDIIPYERTHKGWRKFSFIECVWLRIIQDFRSLGVGLEQIKKVKQSFWPDESIEKIKDMYHQAVQREVRLENKNEILEIFTNPDIPKEMWADVISQYQMDYFGLTVYSTIISKATVNIAMNKYGEIDVLVTSNIPTAIQNEQIKLHSKILKDSFVLINLSNIILQISTNEKVRIEPSALIHIISSPELEILNAIKSGKYSEITIDVSGGEPTHIKFKQNLITPEIINKVAPFLRKGQYTDIHLKSRDGKLITFSETKHTKLK
jgi:DNA-binding transcriptional MerR regulator